MAAGDLEVRLLGPVEVVVDGAVLDPLGPKRAALLALLALCRAEVVSSDVLIDELWGDAQPANPSNALQARVSQLRRALGPAGARIVTRPPGYVLEIEPGGVDALRAERLASEGSVAEATALWRGEPLDGVADVGPRLRLEARRLAELRLALLEQHLEAELATGAAGAVAADAASLVHRYPLRERLWELMMEAQYRAGQQTEALRTFQTARRVLAEEAGLEPGPGLRQLEARILDHDPGLEAPRARDRSDPSSAARTRPGATNLRPRRSTFVGRAAALAEVQALLEDGQLVSLVGPGGAGKTRLALEAGLRATAGGWDGVWLVELDGVGPGGVVAAAATALGLHDTSGGEGPDDRTDEARLADFLRGTRSLVLLDNCEHVIDEAAELVARLLDVPGRVAVIATSREALAIEGERVLVLDPLPERDAARLFTDRAAASGAELDPEDPVVIEICRRLDGIPLALELAAARVRALSLAEVRRRLDDRLAPMSGGRRGTLPRQQTLRATIDWSYDLLFDDERRVLERLAVFEAGAPASAVPTVTEVPNALDVAGRLVDKSLLVADDGAGEGRFRMLDTIRSYATERLEESGDAGAVAERHALWFAGLAVRADEGTQGPELGRWMGRIETEWPNLRAMIDWFLSAGRPVEAAGAVAHLSWLWWLGGNHVRSAQWSTRVLEACPDPEAPDRARAAVHRGLVWALCPDPPEAVDEMERAIEVLDRCGDRYWAARGRLVAGSLHSDQGLGGADLLEQGRSDMEELGNRWGATVGRVLVALAMLRGGAVDAAVVDLEGSLPELRSLGEPWALSLALMTLAIVSEQGGDHGRAAEHFAESLELARRSGMRSYERHLIGHLANLATLQGRYDEADSWLQESEEALQGGADEFDRAFLRNAQAFLARRRGDVVTAAELHRRALAWYRIAGRGDGRSYSAASLALDLVGAGDPDGAVEAAREAAEAAVVVGDPRVLAFAAEALALAMAHLGDGVAAGRLLGAADSARSSVGLPLPPEERVERDAAEARARQVAGDAAVEAALAEGAELGLPAALA